MTRHAKIGIYHGGISTQKTLPFAAPEQAKVEVRRLLEVVGREWGCSAGPAHDIPKNAQPANIAAMSEALKEQ